MTALTNYVTNPSFEVNTTGATAVSSAIARDTTVVPSGTPSIASLKVTPTNGTVGGVTVATSGLTIGQNYVFSYYVKTQAASADFSVSPSIAGYPTIAKTIKAGAPFQRRFIGFTATSTTQAILITSLSTNVTGDIFWVDNVAVTKILLPYFDGNYPYSSWTGTANNSTSTNAAFDDTLKITTDEAVLVNGLPLNTMAWNIQKKDGRYNLSETRGDDLTFPGMRGKTFVANKPIDAGTWSLPMFLLGCHPDGSVPHPSGQRALFDHNYGQLVRQCWNNASPVTILAWTPQGGIKTTQATLMGSAPDVSFNMAGRRAEFTLAFDILPGVWSDYFSTTVTGTPSAAWSNQVLSLTALAGGTVSIDDSVVTVTGPITNPKVENTVTGTWVQYTGTVPAGQTWVIDCNAWTSKVNAVSVLSATSHFGHPRFVLIDPGDNSTTPTLKLSGTATTSATNLSVTATRKHWFA